MNKSEQNELPYRFIDPYGIWITRMFSTACFALVAIQIFPGKPTAIQFVLCGLVTDAGRFFLRKNANLGRYLSLFIFAISFAVVVLAVFADLPSGSGFFFLSTSVGGVISAVFFLFSYEGNERALSRARKNIDQSGVLPKKYSILIYSPVLFLIYWSALWAISDKTIFQRFRDQGFQLNHSIWSDGVIIGLFLLIGVLSGIVAASVRDMIASVRAVKYPGELL